MNPHQKNKIDVKSLTPDEQRLFRLYGKLPSKSDHFAKHLKERKYFDSGDYAMSKAGKGDSVDTGSVGSQHPVPENIPHLTSPNGQNNNGVSGSGVGHQHHPSLHHGTGAAATHHASPQVTSAGSPVKESSFLHRETSAEETADDAEKENKAATPEKPDSQGIPIRR
ncbi:Endosulfine-domain-containing protein [Hypoxylon trugodes]|uniref:Endosulfine-domain-containing protein n=1 Tax=Hypoxylon trugodes TaxID=326681 RepID=UPI002197D654|nr:Endosulfine-domain-containing protein [Hypoxylon trugodes]KAI1389525.1 Endosulfine-domain-containing protein [Hypoxylon trugodes]